MHLLAATPDPALAGGDDILHPVGSRPVGQGEDETLSSREDVEGDVVVPSGATPDVMEDAEPGDVAGEQADHRIGELAVEPGEGAGERHVGPGSAYIRKTPNSAVPFTGAE